jgi:hypothetical protein
MFATGLSLGAQSPEAIRIHPENPRYFLFRGKPLVLITASEHYGSVINRPFDFNKYLDDAVLHGMTLTRTFLLFRELQGARNPSSPCKPESPDYISPFPRVGPEKALDGEPIYDLDQWNPEYFDRLHRFLDAASKRGIVVELTQQHLRRQCLGSQSVSRGKQQATRGSGRLAGVHLPKRS